MTVILESMTHSVGAKGQIVIPKQIRDALRIQPGQEILFEQRGDEIVLRKSGSATLKGRFPGSGLTEALLRARRDDKGHDDRRP